MGIVYSTLVKKARRFNVENRAMRAIERKKPVYAPKHASAEKYINEIIQETPDVRKQLDQKDMQLDKLLKDVYVSSTGSMPEIVRDKSLLPQNRDLVEEDEFGFWQPEEIPQGKASLGQILKFLSQHQSDSQCYTSQVIAKEYSLDEKSVGHMLAFYRTLNAYIPKKKVDKKGMYSIQRLLSLREEIKLIEPDSEKEKK